MIGSPRSRVRDRFSVAFAVRVARFVGRLCRAPRGNILPQQLKRKALSIYLQTLECSHLQGFVVPACVGTVRVVLHGVDYFCLYRCVHRVLHHLARGCSCLLELEQHLFHQICNPWLEKIEDTLFCRLTRPTQSDDCISMSNLPHYLPHPQMSSTLQYIAVCKYNKNVLCTRSHNESW